MRTTQIRIREINSRNSHVQSARHTALIQPQQTLLGVTNHNFISKYISIHFIQEIAERRFTHEDDELTLNK